MGISLHAEDKADDLQLVKSLKCLSKGHSSVIFNFLRLAVRKILRFKFYNFSLTLMLLFCQYYVTKD